MTKQLFALVAVLALANAAFPACTDGTDGKTVGTICQFYDLTKKCATYTSATVCATCVAGTDAIANGVCTCAAATAKFGVDTTLKCSATDVAAGTNCPDGMKISSASCVAGTIFGCKTYNDAGDTCTTCYDGVTFADNSNCNRAGYQVIPGHGYVQGCPDGYVAENANEGANCLTCAAGCKACAAADVTKCTACPVGYILVSDACVEATGDNACDASCATGKCANTKFGCSENCADNYWQTVTASDAPATAICTEMPTVTALSGCKTVNADDATLCDACDETLDSTLTLAEDKKSCVCAAGKALVKHAYAAAVTGDNATDEVLAGWRCTDCPTGDKACTADQICAPSANNAGAVCVAKPAPPVEVPTCEDAALKKAGCKTCAKPDGSETFECSACLEGFAALDADKACPCVNDNKQVLWVDSTSVGRCKSCATACDAAKFCAIAADGTESCADTAATNDAATTTDSANILTAALAILAIILA